MKLRQSILVTGISIFLWVFLLSPEAQETKKIDAVPYQLLTTEATYDTRPTLCKSSDNTLWAGWISYTHPQGDLLMVRSKSSDKWSAPEQVTASHSQIVRPTLCAVKDSIWIFWTESQENAPARIMYAIRKDGKWSIPKALSSKEAPAQNQEVVTDSQGRLSVVWQEFYHGQYDIKMRTYENGEWGKVSTITDDTYNDWDPVIACDSKGDIWVAWCSYRYGDYDIYIRNVSQANTEEIRLSARGDYDLHPSLTWDENDRLWVAWDTLFIPMHGSSYATSPLGGDGSHANSGEDNVDAQIRVVCLEKGSILEIPNATSALKPSSPYRLAHTATPKVSLGKDGTLWITYRALYNVILAETGGRKLRFRSPYWWNVFAQSYRFDSWSDPIQMPESDGALEEVSVLTTSEGLWVAYEMEHRREFAPSLLPKLSIDTKDTTHHNSFMYMLGNNGDIYTAKIASPHEGEAAFKGLKPRLPLPGKSVSLRTPKNMAQYKVQVGGKNYILLWGDLHKHSNISRCTSGNEPAPEDHYKYAHDICQYDFLVISDHAEHTTNYNWWYLQKLADLYNVPDFLSVFYGYEWSANQPFGHHNVIFPNRPSPLLRNYMEESKTTKQLWTTLAKTGEKFLTIPHTTADPIMGTDWSEHDPRYRRLVEIYQPIRGSYESEGCPRQSVKVKEGGFFQDALAKGYKLGTICSTDHGWGVGYAVVYAEENSRQSTFEALTDRRCYGSTTYGLVVDFRMGDYMMGEEITSSKSLELTVFAKGTVPLRSIEIISQGKIVHSVGDFKKPIGEKETYLRWKPKSISQEPIYYYARVTQVNDEMAWTSPIWIHASKDDH